MAKSKKEKPTTKVCKHCKTEIPYDAKVCPQCRKKVKGGKLKWLLLALVLVIAVMIALIGGNNYNDGSDYDEANVVDASEYPKMFSNTSDYMNRSFNLYGRIFNILDSDSGTVFQMYTDAEGDNSVMVYYSGDYDAKEDSYVFVKGVLTDTYEGTNLMGGTIQVPLFSAAGVEESDYMTAFAPSEKTVEAGAEWSKGKASLTIDKVEFAAEETRLYVTLVNNSSDSVNFYSYSSIIVQDGKQYEMEYNYYAEYDELQDELKSETSDSGILVFPKLEQEDFKFVFSGSCGDDYFEDETISVSVQ